MHDDYPESEWDRARREAIEERDRAHKAQLDQVLRELPPDLHDTLAFALESVRHYTALSNHYGYMDDFCIRRSDREEIMVAARAVYDRDDWVFDEEFTASPFSKALLGDIYECRRNGPKFIPEPLRWEFLTFVSEVIFPREFDSAFCFLQILLKSLYDIVNASCGPCSGSLVPGWRPVRGFTEDSKYSGGPFTFDDLDFSYLMGRRVILPSINAQQLEAELAKEARALSLARNSGSLWLTSGPVKAHVQEPDGIVETLVTLNQVAPLAGVTKRTLERYLREGKLPEPDVRIGGGSAHKWFWANLRPPLASVAKRQLPERFPAGPHHLTDNRRQLTDNRRQTSGGLGANFGGFRTTVRKCAGRT